MTTEPSSANSRAVDRSCLRIAPHYPEPQLGVRYHRFVGMDESHVAVLGWVARLEGVEIAGRPSGVGSRIHQAHQRVADPFALLGWLDAEEKEAPGWAVERRSVGPFDRQPDPPHAFHVLRSPRLDHL